MLRVRDLTFVYPATIGDAISRISFSVEPGEAVGLLGPLNAGKTTLCMALAGFVPRVTGGTLTGEIDVDGIDPRKATARQMSDRVSLMFEDVPAQLTQVRVLDEVIAPLVNRGTDPKEAERRAHALLDRVNFPANGRERKRTWELSGGEQQRLILAATLAIDSPLLIFDNATGSLDPRGREEIAGLLAEMKGEKTLILVENDPDLLVSIADRCLLLEKGKLVEDRPAKDILGHAEVLDRADLIPPLPARVGRDIGLPDPPLTAAALAERLGVEDRGGDADRLDGTLAKGAGRIDEYPGADDGERAAGSENLLLRMKRVFYRYDDGTEAISDLSLGLGHATVHAVLGGNGAGKSTIAKLITGLAKPSNGQVLLEGTDTREATAAELAWKVGVTFQNPDEQISERTVREEIEFPLRRRRFRRTGLFSKQERFGTDYIAERVAAVQDTLKLSDRMMDRDPSLLSLGERKIVTIAIALALDPKMVVLDEPTGGLDHAHRRRVLDLLGHLRETGRTVLLIDHDMETVGAVADTVTVLKKSQTVLQAPLREVFAPGNWPLLDDAQIRPPRAARLARRLGLDALTYDELLAGLAKQAKAS